MAFQHFGTRQRCSTCGSNNYDALTLAPQDTICVDIKQPNGAICKNALFSTMPDKREA